MYTKKISQLIVRHLFAASEKPPKLSTEIPAKLLQINILEDTEAWIKAFIKHLKKVAGIKGPAARVSVVENTRGDSKSIMFGLNKDVPLQADLTQKGSSTALTQIINGRAAVYAVDTVSGLKQYYADFIRQIAQPEALIAWMHSLTDKIQTYTGLGFTLKTDIENGKMSGEWTTPNNPTVEASFRVDISLDGNTTIWELDWQPTGETLETFTSDSLNKILDQTPEEYDSDMVWFTSAAKGKELQKILKATLGLKRAPKLRLGTEIVRAEGEGAVIILETLAGKVADVQYKIELHYQNEKQEWYVSIAAKMQQIPLDAGGLTLSELQQTSGKKDPVEQFLKKRVGDLHTLNILAYMDSTDYLNVSIEGYSKERSLDDILTILQTLAQCVKLLTNAPFSMQDNARIAQLVNSYMRAQGLA